MILDYLKCFNPTNKIRIFEEFAVRSSDYQNQTLFRYLLWLENLLVQVDLLSLKYLKSLFHFRILNLFLTYAVWFEEIRKGSTFFILAESTFLIIFISALNSDIGLQFLVNLLPLSFFPQHYPNIPIPIIFYFIPEAFMESFREFMIPKWFIIFHRF